MTDFSASERSRLKRIPERGRYDRQSIYPILDEALICHVGFQVDGQPYVIPTNFARDGDTIVVHGAKASRMIKLIATGQPVCVTVTLLDGIIFARSVFEHSMRYRSVVAFGCGVLLDAEAEKIEALRLITEHLCPGRWEDARQPNAKELAATSVARIMIEEASAKIQDGNPADYPEDLALPYWAGVLPLTQQAKTPLDSPDLAAGIPTPDYMRAKFPF